MLQLRVRNHIVNGKEILLHTGHCLTVALGQIIQTGIGIAQTRHKAYIKIAQQKLLQFLHCFVKAVGLLRLFQIYNASQHTLHITVLGSLAPVKQVVQNVGQHQPRKPVCLLGVVVLMVKKHLVVDFDIKQHHNELRVRKREAQGFQNFRLVADGHALIEQTGEKRAPYDVVLQFFCNLAVGLVLRNHIGYTAFDIAELGFGNLVRTAEDVQNFLDRPVVAPGKEIGDQYHRADSQQVEKYDLPARRIDTFLKHSLVHQIEVLPVAVAGLSRNHNLLANRGNTIGYSVLVHDLLHLRVCRGIPGGKRAALLVYNVKGLIIALFDCGRKELAVVHLNYDCGIGGKPFCAVEGQCIQDGLRHAAVPGRQKREIPGMVFPHEAYPGGMLYSAVAEIGHIVTGGCVAAVEPHTVIQLVKIDIDIVKVALDCLIF